MIGYEIFYFFRVGRLKFLVKFAEIILSKDSFMKKKILVFAFFIRSMLTKAFGCIQFNRGKIVPRISL